MAEREAEEVCGNGSRKQGVTEIELSSRAHVYRQRLGAKTEGVNHPWWRRLLVTYQRCIMFSAVGGIDHHPVSPVFHINPRSFSGEPEGVSNLVTCAGG